MKKLFWLLAGVAAGAVIAHQVSKTEQGKQFFDSLDEKARDLGATVADVYKAREADLKAAIANVATAIQDFSAKN